MNHKYTLSDFKIITGTETDIHERIVTIDLSNATEIPTIIIDKLETLVNVMISEYEREHKETISLFSAELEIYISIDTKEHTLSLNAYLGYDPDKEYIVGKKIITGDKDYSVIKKYFFDELNRYVSDKVKRIQGCVA